MCIREELEEMERRNLSPYASLSSESAGRDREEPQDDIRTVYERDRDRILHCKAFRRLKHKTQVFIAPEGDHYRTRLTHTLEVSQIARTFAKALKLNEDLTEAIALGHDLGHTPFGHAGERVLDDIWKNDGGFRHAEQSVRVVEVLEKNGQGLNLTKEVREGILHHSTASHPKTLEGQAVRFADKIAYINHDIDDAIRADLFREEDIPAEYRKALGGNVKDRLNTLIRSVIFSSVGNKELVMNHETEQAMLGLRKWMFQHVYLDFNSIAKREEAKVDRMMHILFSWYMENPQLMTDEYTQMMEELYLKIPVGIADREKRYQQARMRVVTDYIAGMSDDFCRSKFMEYYIPVGFQKI